MFVRTIKNEILDYRKFDIPYVKPDETGSGWSLWLPYKKSNGAAELIDEFETVSEANKALTSLKEARQSGLGWDAKEYKEHLSKDPMELAGYTN